MGEPADEVRLVSVQDWYCTVGVVEDVEGALQVVLGADRVGPDPPIPMVRRHLSWTVCISPGAGQGGFSHRVRGARVVVTTLGVGEPGQTGNSEGGGDEEIEA